MLTVVCDASLSGKRARCQHPGFTECPPQKDWCTAGFSNRCAITPDVVGHEVSARNSYKILDGIRPVSKNVGVAILSAGIPTPYGV